MHWFLKILVGSWIEELPVSHLTGGCVFYVHTLIIFLRNSQHFHLCKSLLKQIYDLIAPIPFLWYIYKHLILLLLSFLNIWFNCSPIMNTEMTGKFH